MKKVGIITINDNNNYGNRLQNYAVQEILKKNNFEVVTIKNDTYLNNKKKYIEKRLKRIIIDIIKRNNIEENDRNKCFKKFNSNINFSKRNINPFTKRLKREYDYFVVGSDQVWNPNFGRLSDVDLLKFAYNKQKISFAASFGVDSIDKTSLKRVKDNLSKFKAISVREEEGKKIIESIVNREDIEVLIDPTMMLSEDDWDKVQKKPKQMKNAKKYILNYFLGKLSKERENEINRVAKENNCEVINILDKNSNYYNTGPSEFLWLEKNAFLICTDSFHSSVFAMLFDKPFIIFDREDSNANMNSRLNTFIFKFNLKNRKFNGESITEENLNHDYTEAYKILDIEKEKFRKFLEKALDIDN